MAKSLHCRDLGFDCDHVVEGQTEQEILQKAAEHAQTEHNIQEIPDEVVQKARTSIRDEPGQ